MMTTLALPCRSVFRVCLYPRTYFPDFITKASLELMFSMLFFYKYMATGVRIWHTKCTFVVLSTRITANLKKKMNITDVTH